MITKSGIWLKTRPWTRAKEILSFYINSKNWTKHEMRHGEWIYVMRRATQISLWIHVTTAVSQSRRDGMNMNLMLTRNEKLKRRRDWEKNSWSNQRLNWVWN